MFALNIAHVVVVVVFFFSFSKSNGGIFDAEIWKGLPYTISKWLDLGPP